MMQAHLKCDRRTILGISIVLFGLSACGELCTWNDPAEHASAYPYSYDLGYRLPFNTWVRNQKLEVALHEAVEAGGIERVTSQYRLQCTPRSMPSNCTDCYVCSRTIPKTYNAGSLGNLAMSCRDDGEMMLRADVGPGSTVSAMTFWKK